jgi:betaine-homocysteine S-methyltransferase
MELRPPPAPPGVRKCLNTARVARRQHPEPLRKDVDLVGVVVENDRVVREVTEEVASILDANGKESVFPAIAQCEGSAGEAREQLHTRTDTEYGAARGEHRVAESHELGPIAGRPRGGGPAEDDCVRAGKTRRVDVLVVGHSDGRSRRLEKPTAEAFEVPSPRVVEIRASLGEDALDDHRSRIDIESRTARHPRRRSRMEQDAGVKLGLLERLEQGPVICAEGYLFEFERRGYLQAGAFVPEVVLEHPELVAQLHREFVHAGSDVVEAFTYYAHREKLRMIDKEHLLEQINRQALAIAKEVADESGALLAGDICNTNVFVAEDEGTRRAVREMFEEQVAWAVDAGVDYIVGETFTWAEEALLALETIKATGLPAVITLAIHQSDRTGEGWAPEDACKRFEDSGADVVGLNCARGPKTMLPLIEKIRAAVDVHVAALPVPYRTSEAEPTFQSLRDPDCDVIPGDRPFPSALDPFVCNRYELEDFSRRASAVGVDYLGVCCGAGPHHIRAVAEALGRTPPASRYSPDMSKHAFFGTDERIPDEYKEYAEKL